MVQPKRRIWATSPLQSPAPPSVIKLLIPFSTILLPYLKGRFFSGCRCSLQWSADMYENSEYFKSMIYGCCLQHIDGAPKFYIKTTWRITFICMPAKNQRTYIYVYIYTHGMYDISDKIVTFLSNFTNSEHPMITYPRPPIPSRALLSRWFFFFQSFFHG